MIIVNACWRATKRLHLSSGKPSKQRSTQTNHCKADGWSIHQIAAHTRDVEKMVYGWRVRRTLEDENPLFENFDGEAWMAEHYQADEPMETILNELVDSVQEACRAAESSRVRGLDATRPACHVWRRFYSPNLGGTRAGSYRGTSTIGD